MTTTAENAHTRPRPARGDSRHVLVSDAAGRLTLRRLRPWHRLLACCAGARLDRALAAGASPEASARLAARALRLTSPGYRRDLAASLRRIVAAAGEPAAVMLPCPVAVPPRVPFSRARIRRSAGPLASLAGQLAAPGPVPAQGVAMVSALLADGAGPLYRPGTGDELADVIEAAARALTRSGRPLPVRREAAARALTR